MSDIRKMMNLFEAREKSEEVSYSEKLKAKKVEKVIAELSGNKEKEFSDLAKKLFEAKTKLDEIKKLEAQIKGEAREAIASLFDTEDEAYTRLVEVSDFSLQLAKKSEPTVTVKYASVLEELKNHLTPDLIKILNGLEWKFRSVSEKESALKITPKVSIKESENEDFYDKLEDFADRYHDAVVAKLENFDDELEKLKKVSLNESKYTKKDLEGTHYDIPLFTTYSSIKKEEWDEYLKTGNYKKVAEETLKRMHLKPIISREEKYKEEFYKMVMKDKEYLDLYKKLLEEAKKGINYKTAQFNKGGKVEEKSINNIATKIKRLLLDYQKSFEKVIIDQLRKNN